MWFVIVKKDLNVFTFFTMTCKHVAKEAYMKDPPYRTAAFDCTALVKNNIKNCIKGKLNGEIKAQKCILFNT